MIYAFPLATPYVIYFADGYAAYASARMLCATRSMRSMADERHATYSVEYAGIFRAVCRRVTLSRVATAARDAALKRERAYAPRFFFATYYFRRASMLPCRYYIRYYFHRCQPIRFYYLPIFATCRFFAAISIARRRCCYEGFRATRYYAAFSPPALQLSLADTLTDTMFTLMLRHFAFLLYILRRH